MRLKTILLCIFFCFITSCSAAENKLVYPPPVFAFSNNNYTQIIKESPISVYFLSHESVSFVFPDEILRLRGRTFLGLYFSEQERTGWPSEFIVINNKLTDEQIMVTFFHEIGHFYHKEDKCICQKDKILKEKHAFMNELEMGWELRDDDILESSIRTIAKYVLSKEEDTYQLAAFAVRKEDIWKKTIKHFIEKERKNR